MEVMRLRPVCVSDVPVLALVHEAAFRGGEVWDEASLRALVTGVGCGGVLAEREGRVAGFVVWRAVLDEAEILTLAVVPEARRSGVGRGLMEAAVVRVRAAGGIRLFLDVSSRNVAACGLYEGLGFAEVGVRRGYYGDGADARVMVLSMS